jgi:hypothetical integral membrane protein (TIGR02206 family)
MYAILYFWGLGLSAQGLITPNLRQGPAAPSFWIYWIRHAEIVGAAAYVVIVHRYRPSWRDCGLAVGAGLAYVAAMLAVDVTFGWNYGFVGNGLPDQPSLLDFFGPWPWRVAVLVVLASLVMALLTLPWVLRRPGASAHRRPA